MLDAEESAIFAAALDYGAACSERNKADAHRDEEARKVKERGEYISARDMVQHPLYQAVVASREAATVCAACLAVLEAALGVSPAHGTGAR